MPPLPYRTEERFVELFQEVFGPAAASLLQPQHPYHDIEQHDRYIDFALETILERYAIEIDGETYHHPAVVSREQYADQLQRQNSLVHDGWRVFRWTDWQLQHERSRVKEHLAILLDTAVRLVVPQSHLPCKRAAFVDLYEHQSQALVQLAALRSEGAQIALLPHAVAAGKTTTAIEDARSLDARNLFLGHTVELVEQAWIRFGELWPEAARARLSEAGAETAQVVVGTIQAMRTQIGRFTPKHFGYIIIDEAHHATASTYQAVLRYFDPEFLLGLTGTEDRADGESALNVFQQAAHRMDIETAVKRGILCDVRCFRVITNIDLRSLRFNGALYKQADLEVKVHVPARDELIVKTYLENVAGRRAVVFCVSIKHADELSSLFRKSGIEARAVSGQLARQERSSILESYRSADVRVLCACDVLNEGWDSPETEVLMMARPTLSKVIYQQQLGRGMRKHPGKEYLVLFDFVDTFTASNRSLSLHRLLRKAQYKAGARMFGGDVDAVVDLPLYLWVQDYEQIDIFDWQQRVEGMLTAKALSRALRKSEGWLKQRISHGEINPDQTVDFGAGRSFPYFSPGQVAALRARYDLAEVTDEQLYTDLLRYLRKGDMTYSYKPVWFTAVLTLADDRGRALVADVNRAFHDFYLDRKRGGLLIEDPRSALAKPDSLSSAGVQSVINSGPFDRFSHLDFVSYARDRAYYEINPHVWRHLKEAASRTEVLGLCEAAIGKYYRCLSRRLPHRG